MWTFRLLEAALKVDLRSLLDRHPRRTLGDSSAIDAALKIGLTKRDCLRGFSEKLCCQTIGSFKSNRANARSFASIVLNQIVLALLRETSDEARRRLLEPICSSMGCNAKSTNKGEKRNAESTNSGRLCVTQSPPDRVRLLVFRNLSGTSARSPAVHSEHLRKMVAIVGSDS